MADAIAPPGIDDFLGTGGGSATPDVSDLERQYGIPPGLYQSILSRGERSGVNAVSSKGATGRAQLMPGTAADMGVDPADPAQNLIGGAKYLGQLVQKYGAGRPELVAAAYNAGPGAVDSHGGVPPYKETQAYVARVVGAQPAGSIDDFLNGGGHAVGASTPSTDTFLRSVGPSKGDAAPDASPQPASMTDRFLSTVGHQADKLGDPAVAQVASGPHAGAPVTQAQQEYFTAHAPDTQAPVGSKYNPYAMLKDSALPPNHGDWYVNQSGEPHQVDLTPTEQASYDRISKEVSPNDGQGNALVNGMMQGYAPEVAGGIQQLASGGAGKQADIDAHMRRMIEAERLSEYRQAHPLANALTTGAGSFATAGLATEGAGNLLNAARVPQVLGPVGEFASGQAGAGVGPGVGNALLRAGSRTTQNALQGAAFGGESAHLNPNTPVGDQIAGGAAGGAALGAVGSGARAAGQFVGERLPAVPNALQALSSPFSQAAREGMADRTIREFAGNGPTAIDTTEFVPGSTPSLATATGNTGLMHLENVLRKTPAGANVFMDMTAQNEAARVKALDALRGDRDSLNDMINARDQQTSQLRQAAFANSTPVDPKPVLDKIDEILASPSGKRNTVSSVLNNIKGNLVDANGDPETDPAQLYGVRQAIGDMYKTGKAAKARLASSELNSVKGVLDNVIESGSPGFKDYISAFSDASGPINEREFLLARQMTPLGSSAPTLAKVQSALNAIDAGRAAPGVNDAKSVSDKTYNALLDLKKDLVRADINPDKTAGSPTFTNLNSNALLGKLQIPMAIGSAKIPGFGLLHAGANALYSKQGGKINDILINKMANPDYGGAAFAPPQSNPSAPSNPLISFAAADAANHLISNRQKPHSLQVAVSK